ncbi:MAG: hypothetical protein Q3976_06135 [Corynebacterium sp.]|nr:hypothetical protein [Corynebacterium sp.]
MALRVTPVRNTPNQTARTSLADLGLVQCQSRLPDAMVEDLKNVEDSKHRASSDPLNLSASFLHLSA